MSPCWKAKKISSEIRKLKRAENKAFQDTIGCAINGSKMPKKARKAKKKVPARKRAFQRLKKACRAFVFARAKKRTGGACEIAVACFGFGPGNVWYHGWPQKGGNGLKYDVRSQFASCQKCNMGEFGARYRGSKVYENRHRELLGQALYAELDSLHGRKQISTAEAAEMAERLEKKLESGDYGGDND